ncbi:MAG: glutathione peroxidase [Pseudomonadota bacterium]|nr:glutathione peroxidase [Pseudomonadota bacterium]
MENVRTLYNIDVCDVNGSIIRLDKYKGQLLLIVNIASECGFSLQMQELDELYQNYSRYGFTVLAFPSDQFNQEPLDDEGLQCYYQEQKSLHYPIFKKVSVNGPEAHPLFKYLTFQLPGIFGTRNIKWNFTKFLVSATGRPLHRYSPITSIEVVDMDVKALLGLAE